MKKSQQISTILLVTVILAIITSGCNKNDDDSIIKDGDGNIYQTVTIGTQEWLKENLKTTRYNDGTDIPLITDQTEWKNAISAAYCWYDNDITNKDPFGALYNWYAVNSGKLCPKGWHVPSEIELTALVAFLGGESVAGGKLKTTGTMEGGDGLWNQPNVDATNETGFSALPGGMRGSTHFSDINWGGIWWTSTEYPSNVAYYFFINNNDGTVGDSDIGTSKLSGFSVRCLKN
ncbi:MAG: fibrobacter succinogenes major paralogous domain-containing protein [Bacteroidales bacterium]|nr:fibrobacter succinogenes major paralogous domain-containing protein [Bacteroidales bacterium]